MRLGEVPPPPFPVLVQEQICSITGREEALFPSNGITSHTGGRGAFQPHWSWDPYLRQRIDCTCMHPGAHEHYLHITFDAAFFLLEINYISEGKTEDALVISSCLLFLASALMGKQKKQIYFPKLMRKTTAGCIFPALYKPKAQGWRFFDPFVLSCIVYDVFLSWPLLNTEKSLATNPPVCAAKTQIWFLLTERV